MTQDPLDNSKFSVTNGEVVIVIFTSFPATMPCHTAAGVDETPLDPIATDPDKYQFKATGAAGKAFSFAGDCIFAPGAPQGAYYDISASDEAGHSFPVARIPKDGQTEFILIFTIQ